jgi:hypothetical protein
LCLGGVANKIIAVQKKKQQERKKDPGEESQETELGEETER